MKQINDSYEKYVDVKVNDVKKAQIVLNERLNLNSTLIDNSYIRLSMKEKDIKTNYISKMLINNNLDLFELTTHKETLEEYFVRVSGGVRLL